METSPEAVMKTAACPYTKNTWTRDSIQVLVSTKSYRSGRQLLIIVTCKPTPGGQRTGTSIKTADETSKPITRLEAQCSEIVTPMDVIRGKLVRSSGLKTAARNAMIRIIMAQILSCSGVVVPL